MKKRLVAMIAMIAMVMVMLPTVAFAAEGEALYVNGAYTGTDSDGTVEKPYANIADAVAVATGGETIKIQAFEGEYPAFRLDNKAGITFEGIADDNGNKPIIACAKDGVYSFKSQNTGVVGANNVSDTTFKSIVFKNYGKQASWLDASISSCSDCGSDWDGLIIDNCDFTLVDGATATYAIAPCCGEFTLTNSTIIGHENAICMMDDNGELVSVTLTGNTIKVTNEVINGYWGKIADDVTSKVEITDNEISGVDSNVTPVIYIIDYAYQLTKGAEDVTGIDEINITDNTGVAQVIPENINKTAVTVQKDWNVKKSFHTEALANGSAYIKIGEGFYISNVLYVKNAEDAVVAHPECTSTETINASAVSCSANGYTGDQKCTECGTIVKVGSVIPAIAHTEKTVSKVDPTCSIAGYTGDVICSVCHVTVSAGEIVPVIAHTYLDGACTMCGAADPDYVAGEDVQLGIAGTDTETNLEEEAEIITNAIDATTGELSDDVVVDEAAKTNIEAKAEEIQTGEVKLVVEVTATPIEETSIEAETVEEITTQLVAVKEEIAATSTEVVEDSGVAQYLDLSVLVKAQDTTTGVKETLGEVKETAKPITFTITVPTKYLQPGYKVFILRNHNGIVDKLPLTPNADGTHSFTTDRFSTYALGYVTTHVHTETVINAVAENCGDEGYTGDTVCATCGEELAKGSVIQPSGEHHWSDWMTEAGYDGTVRKCWTCGDAIYQPAGTVVDTAVNAPAAAPSTGAPATGDTSNVMTWVAMLAISCTVLVGAKVYRKNR